MRCRWREGAGRALVMMGVVGLCACAPEAKGVPSATAVGAGRAPVPVLAPDEAPTARVEQAERAREVYPQEWVDEAMMAAGPARCPVYKQGCEVVRSGRVVVAVALGELGQVLDARVVRSTVRVDPALMGACAVAHARTMRFRAPGEVYASTVEVAFAFSDRC